MKKYRINWTDKVLDAKKNIGTGIYCACDVLKRVPDIFTERDIEYAYLFCNSSGFGSGSDLVSAIVEDATEIE